MNRSNITILLGAFSASLLAILINLLAEFLIGYGLFGNNPVTIVGTILITTFSLLFIQYIFQRRVAEPHRVAVVGFPQSGKTTLLTLLFGEIFARRIKWVNTRLSSESTIERVNSDLATLNHGYALKPTRDQDVFAYRTELEISGSVLPKLYELEIGDFPGEDTQDYVLSYGQWLHKPAFFKWVIDADAVIFIVDIAAYLQDRISYVPMISSAIRAAWQHLILNSNSRASLVRNRAVALVFTKADLLITSVSSDLSADSKTRLNNTTDEETFSLQQNSYEVLTELGFSSKVPDLQEISPEMLELGIQSVRHDFSDLIQYLQNDIKKFRVVFTSGFAQVDGRRIGLEAVLEAVLP